MALSGSFVASCFSTNPATFRAVVLHELAHIRNGDVAKAYLVITLSTAFIAISVLPSLALVVSTGPKMADTIQLLLDLMLWVAIVLLSGLAVLRTREYYADLRASVWDDTTDGIDAALGREPPSARKGWRRYVAFHPNMVDRRRVVSDPAILFRLNFWDALGVGIAAWLAIDSMNSLAVAFAPKSPLKFFVYYWSTTLVVPGVVMTFAVGALGIAIWRAAFSALMRGEDPYRGTGRLILALTSGYVLIAGFRALIAVSMSVSDFSVFLIKCADGLGTPVVRGPHHHCVLLLDLQMGPSCCFCMVHGRSA